MAKTNFKKYSYVVAGTNRKNVLLTLEAPLTPSELASITKKSLSHVSHTLKDLISQGLVMCLNPDKKVGRIYKRTELGERIANYIKKINHIKNSIS